MVPGEAFPRSARLRRRAEFLRAQRGGRRVHTPHFVWVVRPTATEAGPAVGLRRLGITVTKKVSGAVGRNRIKRILREVFRRNRHLFPAGCDVVVIAKSGAHELGYPQVRAELSGASRALARAAEKASRSAEHGERPKAPRARRAK